MTRDVLLTFVRDRLASMAARPAEYADTQEPFILQLVLLAEISHLGTPERFSDRQPAMLAELSGPAAGCAVPNGPVMLEWAAQAVQIARKYVFP